MSRTNTIIFKIVPAIIFLVLAFFLWRGLSLNPRELPSALLNQAAPQFSLSGLSEKQRFSDQDLHGQVALVNVWATWCLACREEHALLMDIARGKQVVIFGLNYRDERTKAKQWLQYYGDPYQKIGFDHDGKVAIDWGVYGAPETFVIDKQGVIRYKHIGVLTERAWREELLPVIEKLKDNKETVVVSTTTTLPASPGLSAGFK